MIKVILLKQGWEKKREQKSRWERGGGNGSGEGTVSYPDLKPTKHHS